MYVLETVLYSAQCEAVASCDVGMQFGCAVGWLTDSGQQAGCSTHALFFQPLSAVFQERRIPSGFKFFDGLELLLQAFDGQQQRVCLFAWKINSAQNAVFEGLRADAADGG